MENKIIFLKAEMEFDKNGNLITWLNSGPRFWNLRKTEL